MSFHFMTTSYQRITGHKWETTKLDPTQMCLSSNFNKYLIYEKLSVNIFSCSLHKF
jgi:hypothetical protein